MKTLKLTTLGLSLAMVTMSLGTNSAQAGCSKGALADLACRAGLINKQTANSLDAFHAGIGRPLDRLAPAMGGVAAGPVGAGIGTVWQRQDQFRRQAEQSQRFINAGPAYTDAQPMYGVGQGYRDTRGMQGGGQIGNRCYTAYGLSGPGIFQKVGLSCTTPIRGQLMQGYIVNVGY
ncbi:hypothetical protein [Methylobacterium sp. SI9]|uniref:hypothetical protein n=1 Tax=Methylobacterium guangdongense TaxID=3138811 RepID=UPI00313C3895